MTANSMILNKAADSVHIKSVCVYVLVGKAMLICKLFYSYSNGPTEQRFRRTGEGERLTTGE